MSGRRLALAHGLRFSCRQCGDCCREFPIALSSAEAERYAARDWSPILGHPIESVFERAAVAGEEGLFLRRKVDGTCLFLGADDRCEVHRHLGEREKPLVCRVYPFTFVAGPAGGRPVVGGHFACSSLAAGDGEPLAAARRGLEELLPRVEAAGLVVARPDPLPFHAGRAYPRADVERLLDLLGHELEDAGRPFPERLLAGARFVGLVASSRLDSLTADPAGRQVEGFARGTREQVRRGLVSARAGPPPLPERLLFRQLVAFGVRRDPAHLLGAGGLRRTVRRFGNLLAGLAFMAGNGGLVPVGRARRVTLGEVRRRAPPADPAAPEADGALTRYFVAHITSRALLDPGFRVPELLPALGLLFRQYPLILLLARAACLARGGEQVAREDYASALRTADWNFGRVPWTGGPVGRVRASLLADVEAAFAHVPWCAGRP